MGDIRIEGSVVRVRPDGALKSVHLDSGVTFSVPRYAVVGRGNLIQRDSRGRFLQLENGKARVTPPYRRRVSVRLGTRV